MNSVADSFSPWTGLQNDTIRRWRSATLKRRNEDRRNEDRRNEDRRYEDRRYEDRRYVDRRNATTTSRDVGTA